MGRGMSVMFDMERGWYADASSAERCYDSCVVYWGAVLVQIWHTAIVQWYDLLNSKEKTQYTRKHINTYENWHKEFFTSNFLYTGHSINCFLSCFLWQVASNIIQILTDLEQLFVVQPTRTISKVWGNHIGVHARLYNFHKSFIQCSAV